MEYESQGYIEQINLNSEKQEINIPPEIAKTCEQLVEKGRILVVIDLDGTTVPYQNNPKDCKIDTQAHDGLRRINNHKSEASVATITGRSGVAANKLLNIPGATIIGTNEIERFINRKSTLNKDIEPHATRISDALIKIRMAFEEWLKPKTIEITPENDLFEFHTEQNGFIVLERKAMTDAAPEGVAHAYNFNSFDPETIHGAINFLRNMYEQHMPDDLKTIVEAEYGGRHVNFGPKLKTPKWRSLGELIREEAERINTEPNLKPLTGIIYIGDTNADARSIRMMSLVQKLTRLDAHGAVVMDTEQTQWHRQQEKAVDMATIHLQEIEENARVLQYIAELIEKKLTRS